MSVARAAQGHLGDEDLDQMSQQEERRGHREDSQRFPDGFFRNEAGA